MRCGRPWTATGTVDISNFLALQISNAVSQTLDSNQINKKDWSSDKEKLPTISYVDLLSYLLFTQSPYPKEDLKAIKSTEAYNQNHKVKDEDQICCVTFRAG